MRMKQIFVSSVMAASLLATGLGAAYASPGEVCDKGGKHASYKSDHHKQGGKHMDRLMDKLELDQAQRDKVSTALEKNRANMQEQRHAMRDIRRQMHEAATSEAYDTARVKQLAEKKARIGAELGMQRNKTFHDIYQLLTPEQQARFQSMKNKRQHHSG